MKKRNAPGREAEGVVCLLAGDTDAYNTDLHRAQFLRRIGLPFHRASIVAPLAFGEARHA
jgi:hypothetical protein